MTVKLINGKPCPARVIQDFERALGCRLSDSYRAFVAESDGATPETNIFNVEPANQSGVSRFIPIDQILRERRHIEDLPPFAFPVAWAEGGNYVVIDEGMHGKVMFWDHELSSLTVVAENFDQFASRLIPFESVELKAGQVKRVWVDPEFLKIIAKKQGNE